MALYVLLLTICGKHKLVNTLYWNIKVGPRRHDNLLTANLAQFIVSCDAGPLSRGSTLPPLPVRTPDHRDKSSTTASLESVPPPVLVVPCKISCAETRRVYPEGRTYVSRLQIVFAGKSPIQCFPSENIKGKGNFNPMCPPSNMRTTHAWAQIVAPPHVVVLRSPRLEEEESPSPSFEPKGSVKRRLSHRSPREPP